MNTKKFRIEILALVGLWAAVSSGSDQVEVRPQSRGGPQVAVEVVRVRSQEERRALALRDLAEVTPFAGVATRYVAQHRVTEAVPHLIELAQGRRSSSQTLRDQAVRALGALGGDRVVDTLVELAVDSQSGGLRATAVDALVRLGAEHALPPLHIGPDEGLLRRAVEGISRA